MGLRAMIPAKKNRQARGMAKISAYGARNPRGLRTPRPAPPALVIARLPPKIQTEPEDTPGWQLVFLAPLFPGTLAAGRLPGHGPALVGWRACRLTTRSCRCTGETGTGTRSSRTRCAR